jgi:hypothetical protein
MPSLATSARRFVLTALTALACFASLPQAQAQAQGSTPDALRARKQAARRYGGMAVSLPVSAFAGGIKACVREPPSGVAGYWRVPPKVVDVADAELLTHLRKSGLEKRLPFSPKLYIRQYAGFVRDGVRYLFINAVLVEKKSPLVSKLQKAFPPSCGEVSGSWGIQYDPKAKQFTGFSTK